VGATQSIVTSSTQKDIGLFELSFRGERYMPFEGAGVISNWRIELSRGFAAFDHNTIFDVIRHLRYAARQGGDALKAAVVSEVKETVSQMALAGNRRRMYRCISLKHGFPRECHRLPTAADPESGGHVQELALTSDRFPYLFRGCSLSMTAVHLVAGWDQTPPTSLALYVMPAGAQPDDKKDQITSQADPALGGLLHNVHPYQGREKEPGDGWRLHVAAQDFEALEAPPDDVAIVFQYTAELM
jgi:hypothetical protein